MKGILLNCIHISDHFSVLVKYFLLLYITFTYGIYLPVVYDIISQSWESDWTLQPYLLFHIDFSCAKNQWLKTQFSKDTMSSKDMWYVLMLTISYDVLQMSLCFFWKVKISVLPQSSSGRVWEPLPSLCFSSFYAKCVLLCVFVITTYVLRCCSLSSHTLMTDSMSLFIYFLTLQRL